MLPEDLADVGPPGVGHALLGDGVVVVDLPLDDFPHVLDIAGVRKVHNGLHRHAAAVRQAPGRVLGHHGSRLQQGLAVLFNQDDVGVIVRNAQAHGVLSGGEGNDDVEDHVPRRGGHPNLVAGQIGLDLLLLGVAHLGDDLQNLSRVSRHHAGGGGGLDALQSAGVGHHDAFDIFNNVPAGLHQNPVRQTAQDLPGLGGTVGDGDGLGAAHGGHQLLPQDLYKVVIALIGFVHVFPPSVFLPFLAGAPPPEASPPPPWLYGGLPFRKRQPTPTGCFDIFLTKGQNDHNIFWKPCQGVCATVFQTLYGPFADCQSPVDISLPMSHNGR